MRYSNPASPRLALLTLTVRYHWQVLALTHKTRLLSGRCALLLVLLVRLVCSFGFGPYCHQLGAYLIALRSRGLGCLLLLSQLSSDLLNLLKMT